ncbi:MAG: CsgG/HfaB family protein, partial [Elusimicrobia bacterium]|nr:CsgG/HfaB family protein [Elusimicrobiota bacterium]
MSSVAPNTGKAIHSVLEGKLRLLTCIMAVVVLLGNGAEHLHAESSQADSARLGIAVLDFRQRTLSPRVESYRRTLTEGLIERLGAIPGLYVVEREALDPFMGELSLNESGVINPTTLQRFGKALSADLLIEGSILARQGVLLIDYRGHEVHTSSIAFRGSVETNGPNASQVADKIIAEVKEWMRMAPVGDRAKESINGKPPSLAIFDFQHSADP